MQPSRAMGKLVQKLWNHHGEDGHFNGYRLVLNHPDLGLLITEDVEWFVIRRVAFIPEADLSQLAAGEPHPSIEILFHIDQHEISYPIQLSDTLPDAAGHIPVLPPDPTQQSALAEFADQWAAMLADQQWIAKASKIPSEQVASIPTQHNWQPGGDSLQQWLQTISEVETADISLALLCDACQQVGVVIDH